MDTLFKIMYNGELVNEHSDGGIDYGWYNPIDFVPPIGSILDYKNEEGELTCYEVIGLRFTMQEGDIYTYKNKVCIIEVKQIS